MVVVACARGRAHALSSLVSPGTTGLILASCGALAFSVAYARGRRFWGRAEERRRLPEWIHTPYTDCGVTTVTCLAWMSFGLLLAVPPAVVAMLLSSSWIDLATAGTALLLLALLAFAGAAAGDASLFLRLGAAPRWPGRGLVVVVVGMISGLWWQCNQVLSNRGIGWDAWLERLLGTALLTTPLPCLAGLPDPEAWRVWLTESLADAVPIGWAACAYVLALAAVGLTAFWVADVGWRQISSRYSEDVPRLRGPVASPLPTPAGLPSRGRPTWMQDIQVLARDKSTTGFLTLSAASMVSCSLLPALVGGPREQSAAQFQGDFELAFRCLAVCLVAIATVIPALLGARVLSIERESRRLEGLLVTPFRASRLLRGKWCAAALMSLIALAPAPPLLALMYLARGSSEALIALLILITALVGINSLIGVCCAAITDAPAAARLLALSMAAILAVVPGGGLGAALALHVPTLTFSMAPPPARVPFMDASQSVPLGLFYLVLLVMLWRNALDRLRYAG